MITTTSILLSNLKNLPKKYQEGSQKLDQQLRNLVWCSNQRSRNIQSPTKVPCSQVNLEPNQEKYKVVEVKHQESKEVQDQFIINHLKENYKEVFESLDQVPSQKGFNFEVKLKDVAKVPKSRCYPAQGRKSVLKSTFKSKYSY
ncbi:hypothetical protein ACTFIR_012837 [Dictyostelium discoideum]